MLILDFPALGSPVWTTPMDTVHHAAQFMPFVAPQIQPTKTDTTTFLWEQEFKSQELNLTSGTTVEAQPQVNSEQQIPGRFPAAEQDDLAYTAGLLIDSIRGEQNPKFKNSQFLGLMQQLRDGTMVVDGNDLVESNTLDPNPIASSSDRKGKAKATVGQ